MSTYWWTLYIAHIALGFPLSNIELIAVPKNENAKEVGLMALEDTLVVLKTLSQKKGAFLMQVVGL